MIVQVPRAVVRLTVAACMLVAVLVPGRAALAQTGACCDNFSAGGCVVTSPITCAISGTYLGNNTTCFPANFCTVLGGACCSGSTCTQRLAAGCPSSSTTYFVGAGALCSPSPCPPACGAAISERFGGETTAVAQASAGTLLVARGTWLELLNLANPNAPAPFSPRIRLGLEVPAKKISMTLGAPRAFVLLATGKAIAVSVGTATQMHITSPLEVDSQHVVDILADGQIVYVAHSEEEVPGDKYHSYLDIYDFSTGSRQRVASIDPLAQTYILDRLAKVGNVLWTAFHETESTIYGIAGYDVTNPSMPVYTSGALAAIPLNSYTRVSAMTAVGTKLLVSYKQNGHEEWLRAADVSNPYSPAWRTPADLNGYGVCVGSTGNHLRISIQNSGVGTWDTTNANALSWLGAYFATYPQVNQIVSGSSTDYWAAGRGGLMTMNTSNPGAPSVRATLDNFPVGPSQVRQFGNTTAVLDYTLNTLRLYDYTLPEAQRHRASFSLPLYSELLEIAYLDGTGQVIACIATKAPGAGDGIALIDITNPASPFHITPNPQPGLPVPTITGFEAHLMSVTGSRLYAFTTAREFRIYELAQPLTPQYRNPGGGSYGGNLNDYTCMISWGDASFKAVALGTGPFGLWLINTTSATAPLVSGIYNPVPNYRVKALAKSPNYLWVSAVIDADTTTPFYQDSRLESIVVTNLASPVRRYLSSSTSGAGQPGWFDSLAFVANSSGNFLVGTRPGFDGDTVRNSLVIWELLPFLFAPFEAVAYPVVNEVVPHAGGVGNIARSADGSRVILCGGAAGLFQVAMPTQWAPGFGLQVLAPQSPCYGGSVSFSAIASGKPTAVTYRWFRYGPPSPGAPWVQTALTDGPTGWGSTISGAADGFLTIDNIHAPDANDYYFCRATNSCGSTDTFHTYIALCPADFNCSGSATVADIFAFLTAWFAGSPSADYNGVGGVTVQDIFAFLSDWFTPCF